MTRGTQLQGKCLFCNEEIAKAQVSNHLKKCKGWKEAAAKAEQQKKASESLLHLRVQAADTPEFWLDLEMRGAATLGDLDKYLRAIWLECCGHMSEFSAGGMKRRIGEVLGVGEETIHTYDFGTPSVTRIKVVAERRGKPVTSRPITLLARNLLPESKCEVCGKPATLLSLWSLIENGDWVTLCEVHAESQGDEENYDGPVPLMNSPRLGLCGYDGPADPPY